LSPASQRFDLTYDNADQLLRAPLKNASTNALITQYTYGYDFASNRTSERVGNVTTTSTPNNVNEIVAQNGGTNRTLTYDPNGSLTNDGLTRTFEWDAANRLVAINYTGTARRSEFTYDGLSRCVKIIEKTNGLVNSTRKFVWCGMEKCEFRDGNDAVTLFVYPQGQHTGTTKFFYSRDHLGSIREMLKSDGTVVGRYDYDPWGRSTTVINTTLPDLNFTGLYRHSKSNLDLAAYRAYDPDLGRWLSRDPIEENGGLNLYRYVYNDPSRFVDPLGLDRWVVPDPHPYIVYPDGSGGFLRADFSVLGTTESPTVDPSRNPNAIRIPSTSDQDQILRDTIHQMAKDPLNMSTVQPLFAPFTYNCRHFTNRHMYDGIDGKGPRWKDFIPAYPPVGP
jgi:RHS repeat-associated protein